MVYNLKWHLQLLLCFTSKTPKYCICLLLETSSMLCWWYGHLQINLSWLTIVNQLTARYDMVVKKIKEPKSKSRLRYECYEYFLLHVWSYISYNWYQPWNSNFSYKRPKYMLTVQLTDSQLLIFNFGFVSDMQILFVFSA